MTDQADHLRRVYDQWHAMVGQRNLDGLMELYAEDAVLESSAVLVIEKDPSGILRGRARLRPHFGAFFALVGPANGVEWYRPGPAFTSGNTVLWEYPSRSPKGEQLDVVESMEVEDGRIVYHRVYWGFVGFKLLNAAAASGR